MHCSQMSRILSFFFRPHTTTRSRISHTRSPFLIHVPSSAQTSFRCGSSEKLTKCRKTTAVVLSPTPPPRVPSHKTLLSSLKTVVERTRYRPHHVHILIYRPRNFFSKSLVCHFVYYYVTGSYMVFTYKIVYA